MIQGIMQAIEKVFPPFPHHIQHPYFAEEGAARDAGVIFLAHQEPLQLDWAGRAEMRGV